VKRYHRIDILSAIAGHSNANFAATQTRTMPSAARMDNKTAKLDASPVAIAALRCCRRNCTCRGGSSRDSTGPGIRRCAVGPNADTHFRYLSRLLLRIGLGFWITIPRIEANGARFKLLSFIIVAGGLARLISLTVICLQTFGVKAALAMELGVTPLLCLW
jgi:hypothetical protein